MNNEQELNVLMADFKASKQYFATIVKARYANNEVSKSVNKLKTTINKIMTMVNVDKIVNLGISISGGSDNVVLTNKGIKSRYITNNYTCQSYDMGNRYFARYIDEAITAIFNNPLIRDVQTNKILPLKNVDFSPLKLGEEKHIVVAKVQLLRSDMTLINHDLKVPNFSIDYHNLDKFELLNIKDQIIKPIYDYVAEREATNKLILDKIAELENLFPVVFLFGDK